MIENRLPMLSQGQQSPNPFAFQNSGFYDMNPNNRNISATPSEGLSLEKMHSPYAGLANLTGPLIPQFMSMPSGTQQSAAPLTQSYQSYLPQQFASSYPYQYQQSPISNTLQTANMMPVGQAQAVSPGAMDPGNVGGQTPAPIGYSGLPSLGSLLGAFGAMSNPLIGIPAFAMTGGQGLLSSLFGGSQQPFATAQGPYSDTSGGDIGATVTPGASMGGYAIAPGSYADTSGGDIGAAVSPAGGSYGFGGQGDYGTANTAGGTGFATGVDGFGNPTGIAGWSGDAFGYFSDPNYGGGIGY